MADKREIIKEKLDHSGIFNFSDFYSYAFSWLKELKYIITEDKYNETLDGNKRNIYLEWTAIKDLSDYFKIELKLKFNVRGLTDVEIEIDDEKKKSNKGSISVELKGTLIKDPEGKWEKTPSWRFLRDFYNKYIIPSRINDMEGMVAGNIINLKDDMKAFLELSGKRK